MNNQQPSPGWNFLLGLTRLALVFLVVIIAFLPIPTAHAATFQVDRTDDVIASACTAAPNDCSLRGAIEKANGNTFGSHDTIVIPAGTYVLSIPSNTPPDSSTDLDIMESVTITGAGVGLTIIDGGGLGKDRVFEISPFGGHVPVVNISGVTITNGATGKGGGAIYNHGCTVNISSSIITANSATFGGGSSNNGNGGAIYNDGGTVTINNSSLVGNQARGVVVTLVAGGAIYNSGGTVTISNSALSANSVTTIFGTDAGANGGGIYNDSGGTVTIHNTAFTNNTVTGGATGTVGNGGGIYNNGSTVQIDEGSSISGGQADFKGGGIYNNGGTVTIVDTTIGNPANTAMLGGGIHTDGGMVSIQDSSLEGNTATGSGQGGGIYNFDGTLEIENSSLENNIAEGSIGYGGGILNTGSNAEMTMLYSTLHGNQANGSSGYGGGIFNVSGKVDIQNSTISGNEANKSGGSGIGGGIYNLGSSSVTTLTNSTLSGNRASDSGGGIYNTGTITLDTTTITNNSADITMDGTGDGGGIYNMTGATVNFKNTIIADNYDLSSPGTVHRDCSGTLNSQDYNLIRYTTGCTIAGTTTHNITGSTPQLGPLAYNGGPTATCALVSGSLAINSGTCIGAPGIDQRGWLRPDLSSGLCDMGAYEYDSGIPYYMPIILHHFSP